MLRLLRSLKPSTPPADASPKRRVTTDPLLSVASRAATGDEAAICTLLTSLGPAVLRVARSILGVHQPEVEDVCQEAAVALLLALPRFRGECSILHFACRIAVLTAMNARRRVRPGATAETMEELLEGGFCPAELAEAARQRAAIRQLLDELPLDQAEALALHVMLGYTVEETAAALQAPENTVRSWLRRGLSTLRHRIAGDFVLLEVVRGGNGK